jgi:hypothetical protein
MVKTAAKRSVVTRILCIFSVALLCVMGSAQAAHAHPDDSTSSHHACSICSAAHIGWSLGTVMTAPVLIAAPLAILAAKSTAIFRPAPTCFIRPPPAF